MFTLSILALHGCSQDGSSQIRGGKSERFARGYLTTLTLVRPDDEVIVAIIYPRPEDMEFFDGIASGNGNDNREWKEDYKVRLKGGPKPEFLRIAWEYSARTRILTFATTTFEVPIGKLAVISLDGLMKPNCELRDKLPPTIEKLRNELGAVNATSKPGQPVRDIRDATPESN